MRVLGLDLGSVTCGVAVSDPLKIVARSVETTVSYTHLTLPTKA